MSVLSYFSLGLSSLVTLGEWVNANPVIALGVVGVLVVGLFILKQLVGVLKAVVIVLITVLLIGSTVHYAAPWFGWLWGATSESTHHTTNDLSVAEEAVLNWGAQQHESRAQSWLHTVSFGGLTTPPDLTGTSWEVGISTLSEVADQFAGEVGYYYVVYDDGRTGWVKGFFTEGTVAELDTSVLEELLRTPGVSDITVVHTHPDSVAGVNIPPSLYDLYAIVNVERLKNTINPTIAVDGVVVEKNQLWHFDVTESDKLYDIVVDYPNYTGSSLFNEITTQLNPVFVCEETETVRQRYGNVWSRCPYVTTNERRQAADELVELYRDYGVEITRRPLPGESVRDLPRTFSPNSGEQI